jgi:hypothetical protein
MAQRSVQKETPELNHYTVGYWNTRAIGEPVRLMLEWMAFHRLSKGWTDVRYQVGPPPKYDKSEWYNVKEQLGMDFPNLPWLKITTSAPAPQATSATTSPLPNKTPKEKLVHHNLHPSNIVVLSQMHAIMRHLGATCNIAGHTSTQKARVDMIMEFLRDWMNAFFDVTYCNAPWLKQQEADQVHRLGLDQCVKTSPMFEVLRAEYLNVTLKTYMNRIDMLLVKCNSAEKQHNGAAASWIAQTTEPTIADFILFEYIDQHYIFQPTCLSALMLAYREKCLRLPFLVRYRGGGGASGGDSGSRRSSNNTSNNSTHDEKSTTTTTHSENHEGRFQAEPLHNRYSHFHREWIAQQQQDAPNGENVV